MIPEGRGAALGSALHSVSSTAEGHGAGRDCCVQTRVASPRLTVEAGPPSGAGERWAGGMERASGVRGARAGSWGLQTCQQCVRPGYTRDV